MIELEERKVEIMKKICLLFVMLLSLLSVTVFADDVDYSVSNYDGYLTIHEDNTAEFTQVITYHFDSSYNGQIVTLGEAGKVPEGFSIDSNPYVEVYVNDSQKEVKTEVSEISEGLKLKIYNKGNYGDTVEVRVFWNISQILFPYQDVSELNWTPISDWDVTLENVTFTIMTDKKTQNSQFWGHQGYFNPQASIEESDSVYYLSTKNVDSKLELHAYWDSSILSNQEVIPKNRKSAIIKQESQIAKKSHLLVTLFYYVFPAILIIIPIVSYYLYNRFKRSIGQYSDFNKKSRLYEIPQDLSPLEVSDYIFDVSLKDQDTSGSPISQTFNVEKLLQSTLLDLIDRRIVLLEKEGEKTYLQVKNLEKAKEYEKDVIKMAFGKEERIVIDDLFMDYHFDKDIVKKYKKLYKGDELTRKVNHEGNKFNKRYKKIVESITKKVSDEINFLNLPKNTRSLEEADLKGIRWARNITILSIIADIGLGFYMFIKGEPTGSIYILLLIMHLFLTRFYMKKVSFFEEQGIYTAEGQIRCQEWLSFSNMMRDLKKFDKVDVEAVIVWNRVLVYATLFGYAKQVQEYLDFNNIKLADEMSADTYYQTAFIIGSRSHFLTSSLSSAETASSFSVSSGGSSGGGFSGGGGGGGVGAF